MRHIITTLLCLSSLLAAALTAAAQSTYYAHGVAHCILDDGSGTFPVADAGEVFVGLSATDAPQWTAGSHTSATATGPFSPSGSSVTFYYWARAKAGYTFVGWGSTKTSKTPTAGTENAEGQSWASNTTLWATGSEASPKAHVRYAIFRRNDAEDTTGGGVAMSLVENFTHIQNSTTAPWPVKVIFTEKLAYKDFVGYGDGYGVNTGLIASITAKSPAGDIHATSARIGGSPTMNGDDAYGLIYFPAAMPVGTYDVHIPKGLFLTASGQPTAAADFTLTVTPDDTPFLLVTSSPEEEYTWDASPETDTKVTDGVLNSVSITFNKNIARVDTEGKTILLTNTTTGRVSTPTFCSVSATSNKRLGIIAFDTQPNGKYTFHLPADVFYDANGHGNEPIDLHFTVKGSSLADWALPTYTTVVPSLKNNSSVGQLSTVTFAMSRTGYAEPTAIVAGAKATAVAITEVYEPGVNYNDPEVLPTQESADIDGVMLRLSPDGLLRVTFTQPVTHSCRVNITIPAGSVINIPSASTLSPKALYNAGGCTNGTIQLTIVVSPNLLTDINLHDTHHETLTTNIYTPDGKQIPAPQRGLNIVRTTHPDGSVTVRKVIKP